MIQMWDSIPNTLLLPLKCIEKYKKQKLRKMKQSKKKLPKINCIKCIHSFMEIVWR